MTGSFPGPPSPEWRHAEEPDLAPPVRSAPGVAVPGRSAASARLRRPAAAVQQRVPGGGEHPGVARLAKAGQDEAAWRVLPGQPVPGRSTAGSATTRARPPATASSSTATVSIHARRALPRRPGARAGLAVRPSRRRVHRAPGARGRRRAVAASRRPTTWRCSATRSRSATLPHEPGGMMRYGIPSYRLPRDVLDAEIGGSTALGVRIVHRPQGQGPARGAGRGWLRRGLRRDRRPPVQAGRHPARGRPHIVDAVTLPARRRVRRPPGSARVAVYGGGNTAMDAARVARRLGAEES